MAQTKKQKQEKALARLTASIAEDMSVGRIVTIAKRQEYNRLKAAVGYERPQDGGDWLI